MERRRAYQGNTGSAASYRELNGLEAFGIEQQHRTRSVRTFAIKVFDRDEGEDQGFTLVAKKL
jgi:hypothetical protein